MRTRGRMRMRIVPILPITLPLVVLDSILTVVLRWGCLQVILLSILQLLWTMAVAGSRSLPSSELKKRSALYALLLPSKVCMTAVVSLFNMVALYSVVSTPYNPNA